jgi:hypothetical protein
MHAYYIELSSSESENLPHVRLEMNGESARPGCRDIMNNDVGGATRKLNGCRRVARTLPLNVCGHGRVRPVSVNCSAVFQNWLGGALEGAG